MGAHTMNISDSVCPAFTFKERLVLYEA